MEWMIVRERNRIGIKSSEKEGKAAIEVSGLGQNTTYESFT